MFYAHLVFLFRTESLKAWHCEPPNSCACRADRKKFIDWVVGRLSFGDSTLSFHDNSRPLIWDGAWCCLIQLLRDNPALNTVVSMFQVVQQELTIEAEVKFEIDPAQTLLRLIG